MCKTCLLPPEWHDWVGMCTLYTINDGCRTKQYVMAEKYAMSKCVVIANRKLVLSGQKIIVWKHTSVLILLFPKTLKEAVFAVMITLFSRVGIDLKALVRTRLLTKTGC